MKTAVFALIFAFCLPALSGYGPAASSTDIHSIVIEQHNLNTEFPDLSLTTLPLIGADKSEELKTQLQSLRDLLEGKLTEDEVSKGSLDLLVCAIPACSGGGDPKCCGAVCGCI